MSEDGITKKLLVLSFGMIAIFYYSICSRLPLEQRKVGIEYGTKEKIGKRMKVLESKMHVVLPVAIWRLLIVSL